MRRYGGGRQNLLFRALTLSASVILAGGALAASSAAAASKNASSVPTAVHTYGSLSLDPASGPAGTLVHAVGKGFPPGDAVELTWQKVIGSWTDPTSGDLLGASYAPSFVPVASASTSSTGSLAASFVVPAGFGFTHDVLVTHADKTWNQADFKVSMSASISPLSGPVGTPIHVTLSGIGFGEYHQDWDLLYDQRLTGWLSAVTTEGTANATIPATGAPGLHELGIYPGDPSSYLNIQQAPTGNPWWNFSFTVTPGPPVLPPSAAAQTPAAVPAGSSARTPSGPAVWLNDASGPPGTPLTLQGSGFPADRAVQLLWTTQTGSHLYGMSVAYKTLATAETGPSGTLKATFPAPSDLGEAHKIAVEVKTGSALAATSFSITPEDLGIQPSSGPVGTEMTIHLRGTGVTWTSNIYAVVYDNGFVGYVCGVYSAGDITLHLRAVGAPGWQFIELYPAIYNVVDMQSIADYIQIPQLTYAADHPGGQVPEFEFAFDITS